MNICLISSEITPFAKTGGLADVAGALGKYVAKAGHDIRLVMPLYANIDLDKYPMERVSFASNCRMQFGDRHLAYDVFTTVLPDSQSDVYFIHCPEMYDRGVLYTNDADEGIRFALLTRAAIELCQRMHWAPDIFHCNDWQTALLPAYLKSLYAWDGLFASSKTVLTIHNLAYQGWFPADYINQLGLSEYYHLFDAHDLYNGQLNFMKCGLVQADMISTVSPTYAQEIQTPEFGEGLDGLLRMRSGDLVGILNGVDYEEWNPATDALIAANYRPGAMAGKEKNKKALLKQLGLNYKKGVPVVGMIARLVSQKGIDLFEGVIDKLLAERPLQLVVLGSGDENYERYFYFLQLNFPQQVVFYKGYDYPLSHLIEAGSDIFLMPSRFEPCGLNQVYSLKYGTIPVVRKTGGLADSVIAYDWETQKGTGFVFEHYNREGFRWALQSALDTYDNRQAWNKLRRQAMACNFSWELQIKEYSNLYSRLKS